MLNVGGFRNRAKGFVSPSSLTDADIHDEFHETKQNIRGMPSRMKWLYITIIVLLGPILLLLLLTISEISMDLFSSYPSSAMSWDQVEINQKWQPCTPLSINSKAKQKSKTAHASEKTRGIVACVSPINQNIYDLLVLLIYMKWEFGSVLPMEIYHVNEIDQLTVSNAIRLSRLNEVEIHIIDISHILEKWGITINRWSYFQSFHCKPIALAHSCFDEILLVDRDIIPLQNLLRLFEVPSYKKTGALFFHDFRFKMSSGRASVPIDRLREIYRGLITKLQKSKGTINKENDYSFPWLNISADVQESSIVVVDSTKHKGMMEVLMWIYSDASRIEPVCGKRGKKRGFFIDEYVHGDKEIYWLAAAMANESVSFSPWSGSVYNPCEGIIAQFDPDVIKQPGLMWINGNKYWQMMSVKALESVGCPRLFDLNLKLGKRCDDRCDLRKNEVESLLRFKYFLCRANLLTSQLCWPLRLGFSMDWLNSRYVNIGPVWRNFKWFRWNMLSI